MTSLHEFVTMNLKKPQKGKFPGYRNFWRQQNKLKLDRGPTVELLLLLFFFCWQIFLGCMWKSKNTSNDQMESLNREPHFKCLQYTLEKRESILNVFHTISVSDVSESRASWFKNINLFLMTTPCQILMFSDNSYCWSKIE